MLIAIPIFKTFCSKTYVHEELVSNLNEHMSKNGLLRDRFAIKLFNSIIFCHFAKGFLN